GHVGHVHGHFHFEHVHAVAVAGKLFHSADHEVGLLAGEIDGFLVHAFRVGDKFEEVGDVAAAALVADALHPGVLFIVDVRSIGGGVVEQNLHAVGTSFHQAAGGVVRQ